MNNNGITTNTGIDADIYVTLIAKKSRFYQSARDIASVFSCLVCCIFFSPTALALEFQCEVPNDTRYIRVDIPGEQYLCEVSVTYKESGVREVKWHANNDSLFCSARAYEMAGKYEDLWNYDCTSWPDRDGVDLLSENQRKILDQRLKRLIEEGRQAQPPFTIVSVKAVASTPLNNKPGKLALQFFSDLGDFTEIIDDQSDTWSVQTTINDMASQIESDSPAAFALIDSIDDSSTFEIHTQFTADNGSCYGSQILTAIGGAGETAARTPHRFVCDNTSIDLSANTELDADGLNVDSNETVTQ